MTWSRIDIDCMGDPAGIELAGTLEKELGVLCHLDSKRSVWKATLKTVLNLIGSLDASRQCSRQKTLQYIGSRKYVLSHSSPDPRGGTGSGLR
jgi:hypothetical protein